MYINLAGFGAAEAVGSEWWASLPEDVRIGMAGWVTASAARQGLTAIWDDSLAGADALLRAYDRAAVDGGGIVVGRETLCPPTSPGATASRVIDSPASCPPGTGGASGSVPAEVTADELRLQLEEQRRREALGPLRTMVRPTGPQWTWQRTSESSETESTEKSDEEEFVGGAMTRGTKIAIGVAGGVVVVLGIAYVVAKRRRRG